MYKRAGVAYIMGLTKSFCGALTLISKGSTSRFGDESTEIETVTKTTSIPFRVS